MPKYIYTAVNLAGERTDGELEAQDEAALRQLLHQRAYYLETAKVQDENETGREMFSQFPFRDLAFFCRQFSMLLHAGVPVVTALSMLVQETEHANLRHALEEIHENVLTGRSLSEAFQVHAKRFPPMLISMVEAGELSGTLEYTMDQLARYLKGQHELRQKMRSAMSYPMVVGVIAMLVVAFLITFVVPTFVSLYADSGQELPAMTTQLLAMSDFLTRYGVLLVIGLLVLVGVAQYVLQIDAGRLVWDRIKLSLPVFGPMFKKNITARFTRTLATMSRVGVPVIRTLEAAGRVSGNRMVEKRIQTEVIPQVREGLGISLPLQMTGIFPTMVVHMIALSEESGSMDEMMERTAEYYEAEVEVATARVVSLLEPLFIGVMGAMVAYIVVAMLLPMFQMATLV